eukprot:199273-Amphidinium_carterae.1
MQQGLDMKKPCNRALVESAFIVTIITSGSLFEDRVSQRFGVAINSEDLSTAGNIYPCSQHVPSLPWIAEVRRAIRILAKAARASEIWEYSLAVRENHEHVGVYRDVTLRYVSASVPHTLSDVPAAPKESQRLVNWLHISFAGLAREVPPGCAAGIDAGVDNATKESRAR